MQGEELGQIYLLTYLLRFFQADFVVFCRTTICVVFCTQILFWRARP